MGVRFLQEQIATVNGRADDRDAFVSARGRPVAEADPHAAEAERGDFQSALTQGALLHCSFPSMIGVDERHVFRRGAPRAW